MATTLTGTIQFYRHTPGDLGIQDLRHAGGDLREVSRALSARFKDDATRQERKPLRARLLSDDGTTVLVVTVDLDGKVKLVDGPPTA